MSYLSIPQTFYFFIVYAFGHKNAMVPCVGLEDNWQESILSIMGILGD